MITPRHRTEEQAVLDPTPPADAGPPEPVAAVPLSPWLKPAEAAAYLGIAIGTLRNWTSMRFVPHAKRGGVVRYHRGELDRWLARAGVPGRNRRAN